MIHILLWCLAGITFAEQPNLNIVISGIEDIEGSVMVAVYDSAEDFLGTSPVATGQFKVKADVIEGQLMLPFGTYGISVFHDVNDDGELNTGLFGIPKEPIGFSNNAKGSFGPPKFKDAVFRFEENGQYLKIELY